MNNSGPVAESKLGLSELIAMGVGGMIGGGIFSVMGLAAGITGHATPIAFALGGVLALMGGYSYVRLALTFVSDGASFTYLERAFPKHQAVAAITGWTVVVGYVGTLALYAFTFGAYGSELLGQADLTLLRQLLSVGIILAFMIVNLQGTTTSGKTEELIVYLKIALLGLLAIAGLPSVEPTNLEPLFDKGVLSVFMAGALIFVAYEGFQLITNAVCETRDPQKNIPRAIYGAIAIVAVIYVGLSIVAIGSISIEQLIKAEEYALAVAVEPSLGNAGRVLVSIAALLATASAINATMFGASRMMAEMATDDAAPVAFSFKSRVDVPWLAILVITMLSIGLTVLGGLELIAAFSSMTFLFVSVAVSIANFRLRSQTGSRAELILAGIVLMLATIVIMIIYLWQQAPTDLAWIFSIYLAIVVTVFALPALRRTAE
ncbi:MAG: amino acid permease [Gammaproteobacteria bacterium]|nr:MAG: amino acid permease [Gammaproteobacteria bacterium]RLA37117.1 MAG: amino acid permease [Gammaproteobacteria bacterium]